MLVYDRVRPDEAKPQPPPSPQPQLLAPVPLKQQNASEVAVRPKSPVIDQAFITQLADLANKKGFELIQGIPAKIYRAVWEQNAEFLRDRQLFDSTYFDFMLKVR